MHCEEWCIDLGVNFIVKVFCRGSDSGYMTIEDCRTTSEPNNMKEGTCYYEEDILHFWIVMR